MQSIKTLGLAAFALISTIHSKATDISFPVPKHQTELNPDNFGLIKDGNWFVMFYSPTCKYSIRMKDPFDNATLSQKDLTEERDFHYAKLNCKLYFNLCKNNDITGYPTLNVYKAGEFKEEYLNDAKTDLLNSYIKDISGRLAK